MKLIQNHGFKKFFTCPRMYTNGPPKIDENRVYGLTSINIGWKYVLLSNMSLFSMSKHIIS